MGIQLNEYEQYTFYSIVTFWQNVKKIHVFNKVNARDNINYIIFRYLFYFIINNKLLFN